MEELSYVVAMINGKMISFRADSHDSDDEIIKFYLEGLVVAEFKRNNIAGFMICGG